MVGCIGRIVKHNAMLALQTLFHRVKCLANHAVLKPDACHCAPSLAFYEYLAFLVFVGTNLVAEEIVCTEIPLSIPSVFLYSFNHVVDACLSPVSLIVLANFPAQFNIVFARYYK